MNSLLNHYLLIQKLHNHTGIYGIIRHPHALLLVEKSRGPYKGLLDLPGGRALPGETYEEALTREVQEETGVLVKECRFWKEVHHLEGEFSHTGFLYWIDAFDTSELKDEVNTEDVVRTKWRVLPIRKLHALTPFAQLAAKEKATPSQL